jgi:hypothetical protein
VAIDRHYLIFTNAVAYTIKILLEHSISNREDVPMEPGENAVSYFEQGNN